MIGILGPLLENFLIRLTTLLELIWLNSSVHDDHWKVDRMAVIKKETIKTAAIDIKPTRDITHIGI